MTAVASNDQNPTARLEYLAGGHLIETILRVIAKRGKYVPISVFMIERGIRGVAALYNRSPKDIRARFINAGNQLNKHSIQHVRLWTVYTTL